MYGTQASQYKEKEHISFENDVKMYGTQALVSRSNETISFENDVKMYGTQARILSVGSEHSLRMM